MEMEERIKICKICKNKSVSDEKGIVCKLTNEKPTFEDECPDFKLDQAEISHLNQDQIQDDEELNLGLKILSFCIPLAGAIIYFMNNKTHPKKAQQACSMAVWGFVVGIIINVISYIIQQS
jgi:hypothetical protein